MGQTLPNEGGVYLKIQEGQRSSMTLKLIIVEKL